MKRKLLGLFVIMTLIVSLFGVTLPVAASVSQPTVSLSDDCISAYADYTITFDVASELAEGGTISITFPEDTSVAAPTATIAASSGWIGGTYTDATVAGVTFAHNATLLTVTATLGAGDQIGETAAVQIVITVGITNPSLPGDYTLTVATSAEPTAVTSEVYTIEPPVIAPLPGIVEVYNASDILMAQFTGATAIQDAIDSAEVGYTIKAGPGTYVENVVLPSGIDLLGAGPGQSIVDGASAGYTIQASGSFTIKGFTITGSNSYGITYGASGASVIEGNEVTGNYHGIYVSGGGATTTIQNNVVHHNSHNGIIVYSGSTATIVNNTVDHNSGGIVTIEEPAPALTITNNIVTNNGAVGIGFHYLPDTYTLTNNNVWNHDADYDNAYPQAASISADPLFANAAAGDYHLTTGSPCIDAGTNTGAPADDFEGDPRPIDGDSDAVATVDMGADEYVPGPTFSSATFFGGGGDQRGTGIDISGSDIYLSGSGPGYELDGLVMQYSLPLGSPPVWSAFWPNEVGTTGYNTDEFFGVMVLGDGVYLAGWGKSFAHDLFGDIEEKACLVKFPLTGATGGGVGGSTWFDSPNFFTYYGGEKFEDATVAEEGGTTYIYTTGYAQQGGYNASIIAKYNAAGGQNDWAYYTGTAGSVSYNHGIVVLNGNIYVAGTSNSGDGTNRPVITKYDSGLNQTWRQRPAELTGQFRGVTAFGGAIYAVGNTRPGDAGSEDYLIQKYDEAGNLVWTQISGGADTDVLTDIISIGSRLFAVGYTKSSGAGGADAVIMEIDPATGITVATTLYGGAEDDMANGVATDGTDIYVVGESKSFANGGNTVGENDLILLWYTTGTPPEPPPELEQALSFNGIDNYVDCGSGASLDITEAITIEAWIKTTDNSGEQAIVDKRNGAAELNYLVRLRDGYLKFTFYNGGYRDLQDDTTYLENNTFYYLAVTYDRANIRLYVNGVEVKSVVETDAMIPDTSPLTIGRQTYSNGSHFSGLIDEVRISNIARTPAEIDASWNGGFGQRFVLDDDTTALWHMDGTGGTLSDETANDNDGTIYGATRVPGFDFPAEVAISQIVFTAFPETVVAYRPSEAITIQTQDAANIPTPVTGATTINLSSTSFGGEFLDVSLAPTTSVIIPAGQSSATFYYKDSTIGTPTITAAEDPEATWTDASQGVTVQGPVHLWRGEELIGTYLTIQEAIDNASDGDTIIVLPGTYYEHLFIDKTLTFKSIAGEVIIDGQGLASGPSRQEESDIICYPVVWIDAHNVVFGVDDGSYGGFTVKNAAPWGEIYEGEEFWGYSVGFAVLILAYECVIENNFITNDVGTNNPCGLLVKGDDNEILSNEFSNNDMAVGVERGDGNIIGTAAKGNTLHDNGIGVMFLDSSGGTAENNHLYSNFAGIWLNSSRCHDIEIIGNTIEDCTGGSGEGAGGEGEGMLTFYFEATAILMEGGTYGNTVSGNTITSEATDTAGIYGIQVEGGNNNTISDNDISDVLVGGITLNETSENDLSGNDIYDIDGYHFWGDGGGDAWWTREQAQFDRYSVKMWTGENPEGEAGLEFPMSFPFEDFEMGSELGGGELYFWAYLADEYGYGSRDYWLDHQALLPTYLLVLDSGESGVILEVNTGCEDLVANEWLKLYAVGDWTNIGSGEHKPISEWIDDPLNDGARVVGFSVVYSGTADKTNKTMYIDGSEREGMPMEPPKGIAIGRSDRNSVSGNDIYGINGVGILVVESNQNTLGDNNFIGDNGIGIVIENSNENAIRGNLIVDNYHEGILIMRSYNNQIIGNDIVWNTGGESGIHLDGESDGNEIHANNIEHNTDWDGEGNITSFGVVKDGGWVNATGNWWGDASGPYHERENPEGMGDAVSECVHFGPWADTELPESEPPAIAEGGSLAMPRMTAVLGMFMGDVGPEWTSLVVEAYDNDGGVGIARVTVDLGALLLQMVPEVVIPPEKQDEWDNWLSELGRRQLECQGNGVYQRHFNLRDEFMNQLRWYLGEFSCFRRWSSF